MTGEGVMQATEALLRSGSTYTVKLRIPAAAMADAITEQLGLEDPSFNDQPLGPVAVLASTGSNLEKRELLVGARAVALAAGDTTADAGERLFREATGVLLEDVLYQVQSVAAECLGSVPYCFRVQITRAQA